jgi:hypothetical protein
MDRLESDQDHMNISFTGDNRCLLTHDMYDFDECAQCKMPTQIVPKGPHFATSSCRGEQDAAVIPPRPHIGRLWPNSGGTPGQHCMSSCDQKCMTFPHAKHTNTPGHGLEACIGSRHARSKILSKGTGPYLNMLLAYICHTDRRRRKCI